MSVAKRKGNFMAQMAGSMKRFATGGDVKAIAGFISRRLERQDSLMALVMSGILLLALMANFAWLMALLGVGITLMMVLLLSLGGNVQNNRSTALLGCIPLCCWMMVSGWRWLELLGIGLLAVYVGANLRKFRPDIMSLLGKE